MDVNYVLSTCSKSVCLQCCALQQLSDSCSRKSVEASVVAAGALLLALLLRVSMLKAS